MDIDTNYLKYIKYKKKYLNLYSKINEMNAGTIDNDTFPILRFMSGNKLDIGITNLEISIENLKKEIAFHYNYKYWFLINIIDNLIILDNQSIIKNLVPLNDLTVVIGQYEQSDIKFLDYILQMLYHIGQKEQDDIKFLDYILKNYFYRKGNFNFSDILKENKSFMSYLAYIESKQQYGGGIQDISEFNKKVLNKLKHHIDSTYFDQSIIGNDFTIITKAFGKYFNDLFNDIFTTDFTRPDKLEKKINNIIFSAKDKTQFIIDHLVATYNENENIIETKDKKSIFKPTKETTIQIGIMAKTFEKDIMSIPNETDFIKLLNSSIIEIKCIGLIKILLQNIKKNNASKIYETIIMMEKISKTDLEFDNYFFKVGSQLVTSKKITQKISISKQFLEWFTKILNHYKKLYYNIEDIYQNYPDILYETEYDNYFPIETIRPYPHQITLLKTLYDSIIKENKVTISYKTMMGTGKTFSVAGIAYLIQKLIQNADKTSDIKKLQLIFCCDQMHVINEVKDLLLYVGCSNIVATIDINDKLKLDSTERVSNVNAIICDTKAYYYMLTSSKLEYQFKSNPILFFDEPTLDSDYIYKVKKQKAIQINNNVYLENLENNINYNTVTLTDDIILNKKLALNIKIIEQLPNISVLSSATLPDSDKLTNILSTDSKLINIHNPNIFIACTLKSYDGTIYAPHKGCVSKEQLTQIISRLKDNPFLRRFYSFAVVKELHDKIHGLPDDLKLSNVISKKICNTELIINYGISLLEYVVTLTNDEIKLICEFSFNKSIKLDNLLENHEQFISQNLIVTSNPYDFTLRFFSDLLANYKDNLAKIEFIYNNDENTRKIKINDLRSQNSKMQPKEFEELLEQKQLNVPSSYKFDDKYQINTLANIDSAKYNGKSRKVFDSHTVNTIYDLKCKDTLIYLLLCGIGIDCKHSDLKSSYIDMVRSLANQGKLAYLISDKSISYGTNYPINRIFIDNGFTKEITMNTMFQLLNRAGRVGKSWFAEAYLEPYFINRLMVVLLDDNKYNKHDIETLNMINMYKILKNNTGYTLRFFRDHKDVEKKVTNTLQNNYQDS